jgi:excisionase family DNA binding protein
MRSKVMPRNLLTIDEAIRALGVSRSTLWRRLQRGDLPSVRRGGRRLVRLTTYRKAVRGKAAGDIPPFTESHPIFRLIGAGRSGGQSPGARDKHAIPDA